MKLLIVQAMEVESNPAREKFGMHGPGVLLHPRFPAKIWIHEDLAIAVNGIDPRFTVDSIGSQPAAITTLHGIESVEPDLVISAGVAGGFSARGAEIGSVYLADRCVFHDRRIAIEGLDHYGLGDYPIADLHPSVYRLGFKKGTVSSGNALDAPAVDLVNMEKTKTAVKDMEAASVAWVCERMGVPFAALKVVSDLVDGTEPTALEFSRNLITATQILATSLSTLVKSLRSEF